MTRDELDTLTRRYLANRFDEVDGVLSLDWNEPKGNAEVARDVWGDELVEQCEALTAALAAGDYSRVMEDAGSMLPDADDDTQRKLARRLLEAQLEAHRATLRALNGEPLVFPSLASATASAAPSGPPKVTPRLSEVIEQFAAERESGGGWSARTSTRERTSLKLMCDLLGDPRIGDVTKDHMRQFALDLARVPSNMTKRFPGLGVREVLERVGEDVTFKPAAKTVNMRIILLRSLFAWAKDHDKITDNPATVVRTLRQRRAREQRYPFTDADVSAFMAELAKPPRNSQHRGQPWLFWIPRILALSGLRLNEAAQLERCNVYTLDGVPVFDIRTEGEEKTVKTDASIRLVPLHPRLVELGLLDFSAKQPDGYLWPAQLRTPTKPDRSPTDRLSKLLMYRLRKAGVTDKRKAMHSFRHTVSARLMAASVPEYQIADILGHENASMSTGRYGGLPPHVVLRDALAKVTLPI